MRMDQEEAKKRFARYRELESKQERTAEEAEEMKRLLYQIDLFLAEREGKPKEQFLEGRFATAKFYKAAKERGVSEVGFVIGGVAASLFADGESEEFFLECYGRFDQDPGPLKLAMEELRAAGLWPWRQS